MYKDKNQEYFSGVREDIINCLPKKNAQKILEVGAGGGDTLCRIKELGLAKEVVGFELVEIANSNQRRSEIDNFIFGNIENDELPFEENYFDVIICGDVLEHLIDPWSVLEKLNKYLKYDGVAIISLPNIRHFSALKRIFINASFRYEDKGLFDKTHFRFFCKSDMIELVERSGLRLQSVYPYFDKSPKARKIRLLNTISLGLFSDLLSGQYILIGVKQ